MGASFFSAQPRLERIPKAARSVGLEPEESGVRHESLQDYPCKPVEDR